MLDFLCIGAQKAGTTALYYFLTQHEEVAVFNNKEGSVNHIMQGRRLTHGFINRSSFKCLGDCIPGILGDGEQYSKLLFQHNPKIKLIAILRNPVERAYSQHRMAIDQHAHSKTFLEAIQEGSYLDSGYYHKSLTFFYQKFPEESILLIRHEDFMFFHDAMLNKIFDHLEVSHKKIQQGFVVPQPVGRKSDRIGIYYPKMSQEEYEVVLGYYQGDIAQLEKMTGWDLSTWYDYNSYKNFTIHVS